MIDNGGKTGAYSSFSGTSGTDLILRNGAVGLQSSSATFGNIVVSSNATLYVTNTSPAQITLTASAINVQAGGSISSDFGGYVAANGNGPGNGGSAASPYYACSGAGHGGYGGNAFIYSGISYGSGGNSYDSQSGPSLAGSGGGSYSSFSTGGRGGGALKLSVQGNVQVDGTISANAASGSGLGGGAGGMIYASFNSSSFSGSATAYGGTGFGNGGAGTVYFQTNSGQSLIIVDNGGKRGSTNTPVSNYNNNWIIRNGAAVQPSLSNFTLDSLVIGTNTSLSPGYGGTLNFTVIGNVNIQPGGSIVADYSGSAPNVGSGRGLSTGNSPYYPCSGGGHGGYGGMGISNSIAGGVTYDSTTSPSISGSGGGFYNSTYGTAGNGGGYVRLFVNGNLQLDGSISANGGSGTIGGGGGSGGSIYIQVYGNGAFKGAGSISANGGNGGTYGGGGGGGGRIAVYYYSNSVVHSTFNGPVTAYGGGGASYGGAGTVYLQDYSVGYPQLILDNAGNTGTNTTFDNAYCDATVQNRAVGVLPSNWSLDSLSIRSNSALVGSSSPLSVRSISANSLTIDSGGVISLDTCGNGPSAGSGAAQYGAAIRGGAGYGGFGGGNTGSYGQAYGSITAPNALGSGGAGASYINGGTGGGALSLSVSGTLRLNGRISANGGNGDIGGGGGSGGSLNLGNINVITGNGVLSANGGSGIDYPTGGGAGGRIALVANSSTFTGQISATGGSGTYPGGAGTIYKKISGYPSLTIDNGGLAGTNTPLTGSVGLPTTPFDLNIANQAIVAAASPMPLLNNLNLNFGSTLIGTSGGIFVAVRTNANILGSIIQDYRGYSQGSGNGPGTSSNNMGAGGGYGGAGGNAASGALGGNTNGSATQPTDFGSGGGYGVNSIVGGSEGGGAIRLSVGGNLNLPGNISANGDYGWQDNSGGGAGGSIWIAANSLTGAGNLTVAGGNGDLWNGGGGGGGRIAVYSFSPAQPIPAAGSVMRTAKTERCCFPVRS